MRLLEMDVTVVGGLQEINFDELCKYFVDKVLAG